MRREAQRCDVRERLPRLYYNAAFNHSLEWDDLTADFVTRVLRCRWPYV